MPQVEIEDLLANPLLEDADVRPDRMTVERYARDLDRMEPVVVFETQEGLLLADGYHRVVAARLSGRSTIEAKVRVGTRREALRYAAETAAAQRGITLEEATDAIRRRSGRRSSGRD